MSNTYGIKEITKKTNSSNDIIAVVLCLEATSDNNPPTKMCISIEHKIDPVSTLTKSIVDAAEIAVLASDYQQGQTVQEKLDEMVDDEENPPTPEVTMKAVNYDDL